MIAQINLYDELMKFSTPTKDATSSDFPPTANQTQFSSSNYGRGRNNGRNNRGRGRNNGRYTPRCQLCGQYGHRVLKYIERFDKSFYGHQTAPKNSNSQPFPQAYNRNLQTPLTPQDHYAWYPNSGATHHVTNDFQNLVDHALY